MSSALECLQEAEGRVRSNLDGGTVTLNCKQRAGQNEVALCIEAGTTHEFSVSINDLEVLMQASEISKWASRLRTIMRASGYGCVTLTVSRGSRKGRPVSTWTTTITHREL
jgi:hypothetical protein